MARPRTQTETPETGESVKLASALLSYLVGSGTNPQKLSPFEAWAREQGENYPAEGLYRHMEEQGMAPGTLLKAGKWVWGPMFRPEEQVSLTASEEMMKLRGENDQLSARIQTLVSERNGYMNRASYLQGQMEKLTQENAWLRMGRSKEDLATLDVGKE